MGVLPDEAALADALARPSERELSGALVVSLRTPVIVLDECVIDATLVDGIAPDLLRRMQLVPVYADAGTVYVAASRPDEVAAHADALFARRGWSVALCA